MRTSYRHRRLSQRYALHLNSFTNPPNLITSPLHTHQLTIQQSCDPTQLTLQYPIPYLIPLFSYSTGAFIRPTPIQDAANGIFARFLSMAVQSLPPSQRSTEASAGAMMPLTSVSQDRSDNQTAREGVSGNAILRQQGELLCCFILAYLSGIIFVMGK